MPGAWLSPLILRPAIKQKYNKVLDARSMKFCYDMTSILKVTAAFFGFVLPAIGWSILTKGLVERMPGLA